MTRLRHAALHPRGTWWQSTRAKSGRERSVEESEDWKRVESTRAKSGRVWRVEERSGVEESEVEESEVEESGVEESEVEESEVEESGMEESEVEESGVEESGVEESERTAVCVVRIKEQSSHTRRCSLFAKHRGGSAYPNIPSL
jgi:hypothetical protein